MEEIALASLPRDVESDVESDSETISEDHDDNTSDASQNDLERLSLDGDRTQEAAGPKAFVNAEVEDVSSLFTRPDTAETMKLESTRIPTIHVIIPHDEISKRPSKNSPSPTSSTGAVWGGDLAIESLTCSVCRKNFHGRYAKGNLSRHAKSMHAENSALYACEEKSCARSFRRKDARLKHYRTAHPHLARPPIPRGPQCSKTFDILDD